MYFGKGLGKYNADFKSKDIYKYYKEKYKDKAVDEKKFWKVWNEFIDIRMQLVVYNNLEFYLPNRMGSIRVEIVCDAIGFKKDGTIRKYRDWGATIKLWETLYEGKTPQEIKEIKNKPIVYYVNDHVDGKICRFYWDKSTCHFRNHSHYTFEPVRKWNREHLAKFIKKTKVLNYYGR